VNVFSNDIYQFLRGYAPYEPPPRYVFKKRLHSGGFLRGVAHYLLKINSHVKAGKPGREVDIVEAVVELVSHMKAG
jgi:hypothetical protein